jgi:hypothetical protein
METSKIIDYTCRNIHPSIWRALRKKIWGGDIDLYDNKNIRIGEGTLCRYDPNISLKGNCHHINWINTYKNIKPAECGYLTATNIPVDSILFRA